jgi:hypothetical protein
VGRDHPQAGVAVEHAAEDEVRQRHGRLDGVAHDVHQVGPGQPLAQRAAPRVDEEHGAQLLGRRPQRRVAGGGEVGPARLRADDRPGQAQLADGVAQLVGAQRRVLERHAAQPHQPVGVAGAQRGHPLVGRGHDVGGPGFVGPVVVLAGRGADHLDVDPHGVHGRQPLAGAAVGFGEPPDPAGEQAGVVGRRVGAHAGGQAPALVGPARLIGHERPHLRHGAVGVEVVGPHGREHLDPRSTLR